ncbi:conserved exported hypothetical protein [Cupriavidus necator]|uniref:DUF2933 domain-containing protein n=1 Tax=Cupriavidus necator TaxID=106590 RepID=A0A1K0ICW6_CUPNE|nr:conserved exported hypothetical protein [Cupriavidus necator]
MFSIKTMIKLGIGLAVLLVLGYTVFPQYQGAIRAFAPFLLILACPLAMYFGMKGMKPRDERKPLNREDK